MSSSCPPVAAIPMRRLRALLALLVLRATHAQQLRAVPLLLKPSDPAGRITLAPEGMEVLRAQRGRFGIIAAVGPTRTGKSSLLGRAFLRGRDENAFEIGGGVTSHTTGAHILSKPIILNNLPVYLIDTEGFSGIGGRTDGLGIRLRGLVRVVAGRGGVQSPVCALI